MERKSMRVSIGSTKIGVELKTKRKLTVEIVSLIVN